jgi:beta-lactamase class C
MKEFKHFLALTMVFAVLGIAIFSALGLRARSEAVIDEVDQDVFLHLEFKENFGCWLEAEWQKSGPPGMAVAVISEGQVVFGKSYGVVGLGKTEKVDFNTAFRLASVSKTFAGVLTAIMVDEGALNWDDKVVYYLPEFRLRDSLATQELRVKHLLSHTTGLPRHAYSNMLDKGVPYEKLKNLLVNLHLNTQPGKAYNYQNVAFSVIGDVLEVATGRKYEELLQDKIFTPLGMVWAGSGYDHLTKLDNKAFPHYYEFGKYKNRQIEPKYFDAGPAAGVNASLEDMIKYARLMTGYFPDVLPAEKVSGLFLPQAEVSKKESSVIGWLPVEKAWYGLGWRGVEKNNRQIIFHGGFVNGYRSEIVLIPDEKLAMVVLTNAPNPLVSELGSNFLEFWDAQLVKQ